MAISSSYPSRPISTVSDNRAFVPNTSISRYLPDWEQFAKDRGFTDDQRRFALSFFTGANVLLSGPAGTGKSFVLKALFEFLQSHHISFGKSATTGVSALNIGGQTVHSYAGLGLADEGINELVVRVKKNKRAAARIKATQVMFIDEVSMAKGDLLNKLDMVFKYFRYSDAPFGGCQMVFSADFLQLLPVFKGDEPRELAFQSRAWREANVQCVVMEKVVRQQNDNTLLRILNDVRVGNTESLHLLDGRIGASWPNDEIEAVRLFCKNVDVDEHNRERMDKLKTQSKTFYSKDIGLPNYIEALDKHCPAPSALHLKVGAQVLLLANLDVEGGLCNGSVGVIKAFGADSVTVKFARRTQIVQSNTWETKEQEVGIDGKIKAKVVASRSQIPLKVSYAMTAHRAQGLTLDRAIVDMSGAFSANQVYCALSRVRDMESVSLATPIPHRLIYAHPECVEFYRGLANKNPSAS